MREKKRTQIVIYLLSVRERNQLYFNTVSHLGL